MQCAFGTRSYVRNGILFENERQSHREMRVIHLGIRNHMWIGRGDDITIDTILVHAVALIEIAKSFYEFPIINKGSVKGTTRSLVAIRTSAGFQLIACGRGADGAVVINKAAKDWEAVCGEAYDRGCFSWVILLKKRNGVTVVMIQTVWLGMRVMAIGTKLAASRAHRVIAIGCRHIETPKQAVGNAIASCRDQIEFNAVQKHRVIDA